MKNQIWGLILKVNVIKINKFDLYFCKEGCSLSFLSLKKVRILLKINHQSIVISINADIDFP